MKRKFQKRQSQIFSSDSFKFQDESILQSPAITFPTNTTTIAHVQVSLACHPQEEWYAIAKHA
jgi:hypothetical protein